MLVSCGIGKGHSNHLPSVALQQATQNLDVDAFSTDIEGEMIWSITGLQRVPLTRAANADNVPKQADWPRQDAKT